MIEKVVKFCKTHKWEIVIGGSIIILILLKIFFKQEYTQDSTVLKFSKKPHDPTKLGPPSTLSALPASQSKRKINRYKSEKESRRIVESIFGKSFHSMKPDFLEFENGSNLELDMYNEEMKLAFEYQGIQHSKYTPYFHKKYEDFLYQQKKDEWKRNKCREMGILLIEIPHTVKFEDLEQYIKDKLREHKLI